MQLHISYFSLIRVHIRWTLTAISSSFNLRLELFFSHQDSKLICGKTDLLKGPSSTLSPGPLSTVLLWTCPLGFSPRHLIHEVVLSYSVFISSSLKVNIFKNWNKNTSHMVKRIQTEQKCTKWKISLPHHASLVEASLSLLKKTAMSFLWVSF